MRDISGYTQNMKLYGGAAGIKIGVTVDGVDWLVKFPGNLKSKDMENIKLSYSNSPVCEFVGSHVFQFLGIPVHETRLAVRNNKIVVMCKDFTEDKRLYHFSELKATYEPAFLDLNGNVSDGCGTDIDEALQVIRTHPILAKISGVEDRFWQMFIIDFILGNPDRNNGNWGILVKGDKIQLAPVFDNGNCLNDKWDDTKMNLFLNDINLLNGEAYGSKVCFYSQKGKKIKFYKYLRNCTEAKCRANLQWVLEQWERNNVDSKLQSLLNSIEPITDTQRLFYSTIINIRLNKLKELLNRDVTEINCFNNI